MFVDETSTHLSVTPTHARAPRGERAYGRVPRDRGHNVTLIAAPTVAGLGAAMTLEGAVDGLGFNAYVEQVLVPSLGPGQTVVMDNLQAHESRRVRGLIEGQGRTLRLLPTYSPDLMPIEGAYSKVKAPLRRAKARTSETLDAATATALEAVTAGDAANYFHLCGYRPAAQPL